MNNSLNKVEYYPLSHPQKGIWYTEKMYPGTSIGNVAGTLRIKGEVKFELLEKAINIFVQKNDGMRLRAIEIDGQPMQYVSEFKEFKLDLWDFSKIGGIEALYKWDDEKTKEPLKIIDANLFYFALVKVNNKDGGFYAKTHHLISDAWNMTIIGNQVIEYYTELKDGKEVSKDNKPSYIDYILSEDEYKNTHRFQKDREFWDKKFEIIPEMTTLKTRTSNYIQTEAKRKTFLAPIKFTHKLREYSTENKVSVFALFMSALCMYINRISNKDDVVLGTTILNRMNSNEKNTAGMFISTAPVRVDIDENLDFKTLSQNISKETMALMRHQKYPYDLLLKEVREKHSILDNLYDIALSYQNSKFNKGEHAEEYETRWHFNGHQTNSLTIHINDREDEGHLIIDYDFLSDLFYVKEIEFIHQHIINLLWHAIDDPSKEISKIEMLSEREKHKVLYEFNNTKVYYPNNKTVQQLFEEQVERTPDNVAIVFEEKQMTYRELNERANQLARLLRDKGIKPNDIVGLMVHRSFEMIIGIIGILKAGGAYLPIDPEYPHERIEYMLEDSHTNILLTQHDLKVKVDFCGDVLDIDNEKVNSGSTTNLENRNNPNDLIYVIYTSGSTGKPKGVMIEHENVVNFIKGVTDKISFTPNKTILSVTTISFDIFVLETLLPLASGLKVVIANEEEQNTPKLLSKLINQNKIDIIQMTPSRLKMLFSDESSVSLKMVSDVIIGGEALPKLLAQKVIEITNANIFNMYGPTETTVWSTIKNITADELNIGRPIANTQIYILDKNMNLVPIGIPGEIYIGGEGLARGYYNRNELTDEKFVKSSSLGRLYRTGDLARWYADGEIECLGRIDHQVKIRGFRIELEEIEHLLIRNNDIKEATVVLRQDKNNSKYLCAYIVPIRELPVTELRTYLSRYLPNYMIPSHFVSLDKLPLTPNGKIDRNALPEPEGNIKIEVECVAPSNELERHLVTIWEEVLGIKPIGVLDDFFDLGGDSLNVVDLVSRIERLTKKQFQLSEIYENRTVKEIAASIEKEESKSGLNSVILLRKGTTKKNIFFIHGGSGSIGGYANLFRDNNVPLNEEFNYYAIGFNKLDGYSPINISIEELAKEYVERILLVQPEGEYYLAGWCIGGQTICEMALILENKLSKHVNTVIMFNSIAPKEWDIYYNFELYNEIEYIKEILGEKVNLGGICKYQNIKDLWDYIIAAIKEQGKEIKELLPKDILLSLPNYQSLSVSEILYFINTMRSLHNARVKYSPNNKLKAEVYYFEPMKDKTIENHEENVQRWQQFCYKKIHKIEVEADDHSIFDEEINNTIEMLNNIL